MIQARIIRSVFYCLYYDYDEKSHAGTMFTVEVDNKQYIITAKHLVKNIKDEDKVLTVHETQIKELKVSLIGHCKEGIDISVLAPSIQLAPHNDTKYLPDVTYGQDMYFLGFPYLDGIDFSKINRGFPFPFVKKAILSNIIIKQNRIDVFCLDGHNNPGFSGGPVAFIPLGGKDFQIGGVISGFRYQKQPINMGETKTQFSLNTNTGIIEAYNIQHAIRLIKSNPKGFQLPKNQQVTK